MIDIDKNLELFYEREEDKEDTYIGAISKHECVVDGWFVIELLEEVKRLREGIKQMADTWLNSPKMDGREKLIKMTNQMKELIE